MTSNPVEGSVRDPWLKIDRANEHLDALQCEQRAFEQSNPYAATGKFDAEQGLHVFRLKWTSALPDRLGLIAGDAIHNMRSSLDQLAWQLALRNDADPPFHRTEFPIFDRDDTETRRLFRRATKSIPDAARNVIESLQPYHRPNEVTASPLWRVDHFWNIDKHRVIPLDAIRGRFDILTVPGIQRREFDDGTIEIIVPGQHEDFRPHVTATISYGGRRRGRFLSVGINHLFEMHSFIRDNVLPRFSRFLT